MKQRDLLSDSRNVSNLIAYLGLKNHRMFRPLRGGGGGGESLQTYDTNILYI